MVGMAGHKASLSRSAERTPAAPVLRRQCACGTHTPGGTTCTNCGKQAGPLIRRQPTGKKLPPPVLEAPYPLDPLVQDNTPKFNEEEYKEGAGKLVSAVLEMPAVKAATDKVVGTLTATPLRTVGTLGAIGGTVAGLAVTGKELPVQMPFVPLPPKYFKLEGLSVKVIVNGPLDNPTEGVLVFRYEPPADKKKRREPEGGDLAPRVNAYAGSDASLSDAGIAHAVAEQEKARFANAAAEARRAAEPAAPGGLKLDRPSLLGGDGRPGLKFDPIAPLTLGGELRLELPASLLPKAAAPPLQKKLAIGAVDDPLEAEADRAADIALAQPPGRVAGRAGAVLQRRETCGGASGGAVPPSVQHTLAGSGQPLDTTLRADMEARFGHDFSRVRIHSDTAAARSAFDVSAHAYTAGLHIAFASGRFAPGSGEGRRLLAHELAHVVQQGATPLLQRSPDAALPGDAGSPADPAQATPDQDRTLPADAAPGQATPPAQPVCSPKGFARADFLKQPGTSQKEFGLTTLDTSLVTYPEAKTVKTRGGVKFEPTSAALPQIPSLFTEAGSFLEGTTLFFGTNPGDCPSKRYPIKWVISPKAATSIARGEAEHCEDFQLAFDLSLARFSAAVNVLAQSGKVFPSDKAALANLGRTTGVKPADWRSTFVCLAKKTTLRDTGKFHDPLPRAKMPDQADGCQFVTGMVHAASFPEIGKHPSADIIKGCGEQVPAGAPAKGAKTSALEPVSEAEAAA